MFIAFLSHLLYFISSGFNVCADCSRKKFLIAAVDPKNEVRVCNFCHITLSSGVGVASTYETGATVAESASQNPPTKPVRPVSLTAIKSTPSTPVSGSGSSSQVSSQNSSPATSPVSKPVPPPPPPRPDASSKQGAFTYKNQRSSVKLNPKLFSSAFDITSHIKTRYSVIDQIVSYLFSSSKFSKNIKMLTNGGVTSSPMKNKSMSTGSPMMQSPTMQQQQQRKDLCRCCSLHFDDKVHKRAECKNWYACIISYYYCY